MSLQTNVFENGRWVTRSLDPYHVRAQNTRREEEKTASLSNSPEKAPSLGLLTRTLVRSSVTKWIIPARIRHKTKNDVLFIGADCVTIKEASGDYTLKNVAVKDDFDSPIRAARILGDPQECDEGDKYNAVERAAKTFTLTRGALTGQIYGEWPIRVDGAKNPESVAYLPRELPPHVLVLTLESNQLVFMCAVNGPSNQPPLLSSQHPLPVARSLNQRLGQRIAVDPKSRAMAVAAHEGVVCLYALKSMDLMRKELREGLGLNPIREERLLPVDGVIQKMEFLRPPDNDPGQVILLLIVSWKAKCMMIWYDWNTANNLRESQLQATRYPLPEQERSPLLLIPLTKSTTFMLVCKRAITLYKDLLIGTPTRYVQHLEEEKDPEEPGTSRSLPLWTQWARPVRSGGHRFTQAEDAIYLCREDGIVQYLEFYNNVDHMLNSTHQAGRLGITVDTAFAILDVGPNTKDLIAVGGDESEGGLWRVEPRTDGPILVDVIANWAPLSDFTMFSDPDDPRDKVGDIAGPSLACRGQQRMFACTGRNKHGAVSDLRYGVQASQIVQAADFSSDDTRDAMQSGVLGIWAFHGFFGDTEYQFQGREERLKDVTYVLISHPTHTSLLFMPLEQVPELVTDASLDLTTCTIFASITASGQLIQVTESSIILSSISPPQEYIDEDKKKKFKYQGVQSGYASQIADSSARIMAACIYNDDKESIILAAVQRDGHYYLQLANIVTTYERQGEPWLLDSQPSCMQLHKAEHTLLALVATVDGKFQVFIVGDRGLVRSKASPYTFPAGSFAICDSIAIMTSKSEAGTVPQHLVVCGLRNGLIQTLHCTEADSIYNLTLCETLVVGNTSVTVVTDITRQSRVICHCERSLCTLEYPAYSLYRAPATAHIIWMTDRDKPAFTQGALSMFTQAVHSWLPEEVPGLAAGALIGINGESLQVLKLDSDPEAQMVPQRQTIGGTPQRIIYSCYLAKLIVLYKKLRVTKAPQRNASRIVLGTRAWQPSIAFLDPDTTTTTSSRADVVDVKQENVQDENDELLASERKATEEFLGVSEWFPNINGDQYHFLVVNTKLEQNSKEVGRLLVFKVVKQANCKPRLFTKKKIMLPAPVYYVAEYPDKQSIIYCSGSKLYLQSLDPAQSGLKFQTPIMAEMRSPIRYLTIKAPYIFVSSSRESLAVYKYEAGKLVYQYGDQSARAGLHHVHVPEHSLVLASDNGNAVIGLWQPPERRIDNTMTPVFEAILPRSMTCLSRVTPPVWYHELDKPRNEQSIIGGSIDGTIIQFDVLTKGWRLLRFIQNMAERNEVICPFRGGGPFKRHIEPSTSKPHYMHINGDILKRVVERGGEQVIKGMLDLKPDLDSHTDFDTAEARWERFKELAEEAVDTTDGNWLANVVQWLRYRLLSAL